MSRAHLPGATLHLNVALLECDSPTTLAETLLILEAVSIHAMQVGDAALAFPASELETVRQALEDRQMYPTIIGALPGSPPDEV